MTALLIILLCIAGVISYGIIAAIVCFLTARWGDASDAELLGGIWPVTILFVLPAWGTSRGLKKFNYWLDTRERKPDIPRATAKKVG